MLHQYTAHGVTYSLSPGETQTWEFESKTRATPAQQTELAPPTGLEPATIRLEGGCSIR